MNIFSFRKVRVSLLVLGIVVILALLYLRSVGDDGARETYNSIKHYVHEQKRMIETEIERHTGHNHPIRRLSNLWTAEDHPDALEMTEMSHCENHVMHKLVELGLSLDRRDLRDMAHMSNTHEVDCTSYHHSSELKRQVHANVLEIRNVYSKDVVTLVTHLTSDRFDKLTEVIKKWKGPVSAAVYVRESEHLEEFANLVCSRYIHHNWREVYLHFIKEEGVFYPVNYLRNTALTRVQTTYSFILDVDFVPKHNLYEELLHYTRTGLPGHRQALVIPAFEVVDEEYFATKKFPWRKSDLIIQWRDGDIRPFHSTGFAHGHNPTDYPQWVQASKPYKVTWKRWYEPYVVLRTDAAPRFHKQFVERGFDKSSFIMELHAMGFKFYAVPEGFVVHTPHSLANTQSFKDMRLNRCSKEVYEHFLIALGQKYKFFLSKEDLP